MKVLHDQGYNPRMKIIDNTSQLFGDDLKGTLEKQFNKRIAINAELRTARQELKWLTTGKSCATQTNPTRATASSASGLVHSGNNITND